MYGVTITDHDDRGVLCVQLKTILEILEQDVATSKWKVEDVEALGIAASSLHEISDNGAVITNSMLLSLLKNINQVVDGQFSGYSEGAIAPWITICAVDSSAYDVCTTNADAIRRLCQHFNSVEFIPGMHLM